MTYHFEFDAAGRPTNVKVGSQLLSKTTYNADGTVKQVDYGNEDSIQYTYDAFKRLTGVRGRWDAEDRYVYEYGANGQVARLTNDELSTVSTSEYDAANRPMRITHKNSVSDVHLYTGEVTYDQYNNLAAFKEQVGADRAAYTTTFTHDNENRPTQLDFGSSRQVAYVYDGLGRVSKRTVNAGGTAVETNYGYLAGGHGTGSTTPLVQTISQNGMTLTYTYDDAGNITSVSDGSKTVSYAYDLLGQLIRANDPYDTTAGDSGTTWVYSYDQGGNILSRAAYAFTTDAVGTAMQTNRYVYDDANWKDKLTTYNGKTIPYDAIGNPLSDGNWNLTWVDGRRLRSMYKGEVGQPGYDEITFEYNENGLRTKKNRMFYDSATGTVRQQTTEYTLHGKNIVHWSSGTNTMHFFYDAQNKPAVVVHNGKPYGYLYNLQGDVIALIDSSGNRVVEYRYDAWGRILSKTGTMANTLGTLNPFRYRGYVYDGETGLYYLRSRYYKPNWARFLNADCIYHNNLFNYCANAPTVMHDSAGQAANTSHFVMTILHESGGGNRNLYPNYGVSKEIAQAIDVILSDSKKWAYSGKGANGKYVYGVQRKKNYTTICCAYLMVGIMGGGKGVPGRRRNCNNLQKLTSLEELKPGMEIFQGSKHCGLVVMYDFGNGPELAVFQSTAVANLEKNSSISAAVFMDDENAGPNITALRKIGAWTDFGYPKINMDKAFFFDTKNKLYLFGD